MKIDIESFVKKYNLSSKMIDENQLIYILKNLQIVLENNIEGDIVELGCNIGTTTIFISRLLKLYKSDKKIHVYDSWKGLPKKHENDNSSSNLGKGCFKITKNFFIDNLIRNNVQIPNIHSGWFSEIKDDDFPNTISFALFDGYFYLSIIDSFNKTYKKIFKNGIIVINKYNDSSLPGIKKACNIFLHEKPEHDHIENYCDKCNITKIIKIS